jgi:predicted ABC-type ATPase
MSQKPILNLDHPLLIVVRGIPGSGKTYLAEELRTALGADNVVMLDPDATDYDSKEYQAHTQSLTAEGVDPKLHAYRFLRGQAYDGIADHKIIIWNQPFTNLEIFHKMVGRMHDQAAACNTTLPILVVEVVIDDKIAKARVAKRMQAGGHGPSDATFERFVRDYATFANEGYDTVTVQGEDDRAASVAKIVQAAESLLQQ